MMSCAESGEVPASGSPRVVDIPAVHVGALELELGPVGVAVAVGSVLIESIEAGKSLRALYDCEER